MEHYDLYMYKYDLHISTFFNPGRGGGVVLPYIGYTGMCSLRSKHKREGELGGGGERKTEEGDCLPQKLT